ncbi:MAG: mltF 1, partial [Gammaproteobacteria bacterium]|nr:mltF 1 [Gammaproteobacteria bacterium]
MLAEFAAERQLRPVWVSYRSTDDLFSYMNEYNGDLIIADLDDAGLEFDTPVEYTLPWGISSQQLVSRSDSHAITSSTDLAGRRIAIKQSSPAWSDLEALASVNPTIQIEIIPEQLTIDTILSRVSAGHYDLAVVDNFSLEQKLPDFPELELSFKLGMENIMAWAVRSASGSLHATLNQFLYKNHLKLNVARTYREDLPDLQKRKVLRLITYQGPVNYYLDNGRLRGFEYELLNRFAKSRGMRLSVVIAETHAQMAEMLVQGRGDIVAAFVPQTSFTGSNVAFTA